MFGKRCNEWREGWGVEREWLEGGLEMTMCISDVCGRW